MLAYLLPAIRCRCCPDGLFTGLSSTREPAEESGPRRALAREDFIGLLRPHELDRGAG